MDKHRYIGPYVVPFAVLGFIYWIIDAESRWTFALLLTGVLLVLINAIIVYVILGNFGSKRFGTFDTSSIIASHEENVKDFMKSNPTIGKERVFGEIPLYRSYPYVALFFGFIFIVAAFIV